MGSCTTVAKPFWQAHFSKEKEKAAILASASHTVAERRGIGGYVETSNTTNAFPEHSSRWSSGSCAVLVRIARYAF